MQQLMQNTSLQVRGDGGGWLWNIGLRVGVFRFVLHPLNGKAYNSFFDELPVDASGSPSFSIRVA